MSSSLDPDRLAVLVHEVRSPVAALSAIAGALSDRELDTGARRELGRLATLACQAIERIVADATVASIRRETIDPFALVRDVAQAAELRGVRLAVSVPERSVSVEADPARLRQALDNLITNAVVHGGPASEVSVTARVDETLFIDVSDTGPGIEPGDLDRIFDVGVRLEPRRPGTGLGLTLARLIAEGHGGTLTAASIPGEGTTFTISLPLIQP